MLAWFVYKLSKLKYACTLEKKRPHLHLGLEWLHVWKLQNKWRQQVKQRKPWWTYLHNWSDIQTTQDTWNSYINRFCPKLMLAKLCKRELIYAAAKYGCWKVRRWRSSFLYLFAWEWEWQNDLKTKSQCRTICRCEHF